MRFSALLISLSFLLFSNTKLNAQDLNSQISGIAQSIDKEAAAFSTVSLYTENSFLLDGVASNDKGEFVFKKVQEGKYYIEIQNLEYTSHKSQVFSVEAGKNKDLGVISLYKASINLDEVKIETQKMLVEVHPDKMTFNVASLPTAAGNNGLEILGKAPGVLIDLDNNIVLQGKSGVRIYINGRPSRLSGPDLVTFLESMRADNIESIDIITNPSARYEAEGNAGIIDIKLKNNSSLGYKGSVIGGYSKGTLPQSNLGVNMSYGRDKLNLNLSVNRFDNQAQDDFINTQKQNGFEMLMESEERMTSGGFNLTAGANYDFNTKHSVNLFINGILANKKSQLYSNTDIWFPNSTITNEILDSRTIYDQNTENLNTNLNYIWRPSKTSLINMDASIGTYSMSRETMQPNFYYAVDETTLLRQIQTNYAPKTDIDLFAYKLDFEKSYDKISFELGAKYAYIQTNNDFTVFKVENLNPIYDSSRSNQFNYTEKVAAAYASSNITLTDKIQAKVGLRVENTASEGILESNQQTNDQNVKRNYFDFFPNVGLAMDLSENSKMSLGYGRRLARPNYQSLNPFENKISEILLSKGNPFLEPNYITNYQLTYAFKRKLIISNTYSISRNFFSNLIEIADSTSTIIIPRNMDKSTTNGFSISYPLRVTNKWNMHLYGIYNRTTYDGIFDTSNITIDITANIYNARVSNTFSLPADILFDITGSYNSFYIWRGSILVEGFWGIDLGLKKSFWDNKLQVRASASDILNTRSDFFYNGDYGGMQIQGVRSFDISRFGISASYNFGNQKIKQQKRQGGLGDELNRIAE